MYSIVIFTKENVCEGVPTSWVKCVGKQTFCCWPAKGDIRKLIKKAVDPGSFPWTLSKCTVKSTAPDFLDMIQKRKEAEIMTTENQSSDSDSVDEPPVANGNCEVAPHLDSEEEQATMEYPTPPEKIIPHSCKLLVVLFPILLYFSKCQISSETIFSFLIVALHNHLYYDSSL